MEMNISAEKKICKTGLLKDRVQESAHYRKQTQILWSQVLPLEYWTIPMSYILGYKVGWDILKKFELHCSEIDCYMLLQLLW